jgi:hypothetical protein
MPSVKSSAKPSALLASAPCAAREPCASELSLNVCLWVPVAGRNDRAQGVS